MITPRALAFLFAAGVALPCHGEEFSRQQATGACMMFIKQALHDPGSASFGHSSEAAVIIKGNRAMVIRSVRARNAYNALRLEEFMCLMELNQGMITPAFVGQKGEQSAKARAIIKKWQLIEPDKPTKKKP